MSEEIQVKERPILFSGEMVRAILAGKKTQTRRVVKCPIWEDEEGLTRPPHVKHSYGSYGTVKACPYGALGDRLWVRETFAVVTGPNRDEDPEEFFKKRLGVTYAADWNEKAPFAWKPSIFMPRWVSRLTLEITEIRIERLQEISNEDAECEGVKADLTVGEFPGWQSTAPAGMRRVIDTNFYGPYRDLWEKINGPRSWEENPFVWVVTFKPLITAD